MDMIALLSLHLSQYCDIWYPLQLCGAATKEILSYSSPICDKQPRLSFLPSSYLLHYKFLHFRQVISTRQFHGRFVICRVIKKRPINWAISRLVEREWIPLLPVLGKSRCAMAVVNLPGTQFAMMCFTNAERKERRRSRWNQTADVQAESAAGFHLPASGPV